MKRVALIAAIVILLSGCSYTDFLPATPSPVPPPATATATIFMTPSQTPTITPTQPTPTFTTTPTLIYLNGVPAATDTWTPQPTLWTLPSATASVQAQALLGNGPFATIIIPGKNLYWGSCDSNLLRVTVKVQDGVPAHSVLIFLRLQDVKTGDTTKWGGGAIMTEAGTGVFTYDLTAKAFEHYHDYLQAWGQYQFVALDAHLGRIGASTMYLNNLTIAPCP